MKKYILAKMHIALLLLIFLSVTGLTAQEGYKDYKWGMNIDQVKEKCSDLEVYDYIHWPVPSYAFMFIYKDEIVSSIPNPLDLETGEISSYKSNKNELTFYFVNKKLVAVELMFFQNNILADLAKQNGSVSPVSGSYGNYRYQTATWYKNKNRIIVWEDSGYGREIVTYVDGNWLTTLLSKTIVIFRGERAGTKSRLD